MKLLPNLSIFAFALSFVGQSARAETELYDNLEELLSFRGRSIFQTPDFKGLLAQPFRHWIAWDDFLDCLSRGSIGLAVRHGICGSLG